MKKFVIVLAVLITGLTQAQEKKGLKNVNVGDAPVFKFKKEVIDYGKIDLNSDGQRVFEFTNVGKSPLVITNVKSSCGCTVPSKPKDPIMPGKSGKITVKYATNRPGGFSKSITIFSNASEKVKVVRIKGIVLRKQSPVVKEKPVMSSKS
ncbi:MAG: DUF1573 domain-containing protein [Lutibacter sp.]